MTDLLAPIVLVLIKSNPRGLKSLASLIRDDPKPEEVDEPPALTAGIVIKGEGSGHIHGIIGESHAIMTDADWQAYMSRTQHS